MVNGSKRHQALVKRWCYTYITHMLNIISFLLGLVALIVVIPATIPFLGWANWLALPLIVAGLVAGQLSLSTSGRNFCALIGVIAAIRLTLGGGII